MWVYGKESETNQLYTMDVLDKHPIDILYSHQHNQQSHQCQKYANQIVWSHILIKVLVNHVWERICRIFGCDRIYDVLWRY